MIDYEKNINHRNFPSSSSSDLLLAINGGASVANKRKRRPAGTPDPDAEVVSLSPRTLLESDRYVCEICNQGFQRDQNLQMHRRRHKVPWKLLKREKKDEEVKKRVYVCPEPTCLHHDPCHALGDLVGIKKHFRRKHSVHKQWVCERCSKGYAVQSDYKAHLKTCGSRGHSCDCGRVFSRVESFIEHQDTCTIRQPPPSNHRPQQHTACPAAPPRIFSTASFGPLLHGLPLLRPPPPSNQRSLDLAYPYNTSAAPFESLELQLSIGMAKTSAQVKRNEEIEASLAKERAYEEAMKADQMRQEAKRQIEMAETDFENAKRIRKEAKAELEKAHVVREVAIKRINTTMLDITCHSCKQLFQLPVMADESTSSLVMSYVSSATTEGECE
ncbi:unnamed protein product [Microthlaspi erraticum]|uniref:C2H2-type domain-containing protein n=1 Tax=Microthlaspi erraticum TaxID=1685480 RepID=A0A6D2J8P0_9BRAS|nr:unnamed protein product [Microthlaspi erraticum]